MSTKIYLVIALFSFILGAQLHVNPRYKEGVGGSYTMLAKAEQTITQNQPPPPQQ